MDTTVNNAFSDGLLTEWHVVNLHHMSLVVGFCFHLPQNKAYTLAAVLFLLLCKIISPQNNTQKT